MYRQAQLDHTMFFHHTQDVRKVILIVYVDDIILNEDNFEEIERLKKALANVFKVKVLWQNIP